MQGYFDICGTHIALDSIIDFRIIDVEFIFRPVFHETRKSMLNSLSGKKFDYDCMQPYAAIIGQQGQKSVLGEYVPKTFKEALGKDLSDAVIYTIADKLKIKALKQCKYQCLNLAKRAFSTYLDDVPVMVTWNDGRIAEVFKEDPLYATLQGSKTPGIQFVSALIIKSTEPYIFYGNGIQLDNAYLAFEQLKSAIEEYQAEKSHSKVISTTTKHSLPKLPKLRLPGLNKENQKTNQDV